MLKLFERRLHLLPVEADRSVAELLERDHPFLHHLIDDAGRGQIEAVLQLFLGQEIVRGSLSFWLMVHTAAIAKVWGFLIGTTVYFASLELNAPQSLRPSRQHPLPILHPVFSTFRQVEDFCAGQRQNHEEGDCFKKK